MNDPRPIMLQVTEIKTKLQSIEKQNGAQPGTWIISSNPLSILPKRHSSQMRGERRAEGR